MLCMKMAPTRTLETKGSSTRAGRHDASATALWRDLWRIPFVPVLLRVIWSPPEMKWDPNPYIKAMLEGNYSLEYHARVGGPHP